MEFSVIVTVLCSRNKGFITTQFLVFDIHGSVHRSMTYLIFMDPCIVVWRIWYLWIRAS